MITLLSRLRSLPWLPVGGIWLLIMAGFFWWLSARDARIADLAQREMQQEQHQAGNKIEQEIRDAQDQNRDRIYGDDRPFGCLHDQSC